MRCRVLSVLLVSFFAPATTSEAKDDGDKKTRAAGFLKLAQQAAAEYEFYLGTNRKTKLILQPKPALRWTNPIRKTADGAVFIWTLKGRPEAAACVYIYGESGIDHEFQSLSLKPLTAEYRGQTVWTPVKPGVELKVVLGTNAPSRSATLRLSQMRGIARRFTASVGKDKARHEIRLLTQPIYRYKLKDSDLLDGALFAFVQGTDPELLLLIEAWRKETKWEWRYGLARMTSVLIEARYRDRVVWNIPRWNWRRDPKKPYITFSKKRGR